MVRAGYSPSVRLFEAGACGVPVISDRWKGIDTFFTPGSEIMLADSADEVIAALTSVAGAAARAMGRAARERVLAEHTAARRAAELENYILAARESDAFSLAA